MVEALNIVYTKFNPTEDPLKYCVKVADDSIYIDPLVKTKAGNFRLTSIDASCEKEIEVYKESDTDLYMYIDYNDSIRIPSDAVLFDLEISRNAL